MRVKTFFLVSNFWRSYCSKCSDLSIGDTNGFSQSSSVVQAKLLRESQDTMNWVLTKETKLFKDGILSKWNLFFLMIASYLYVRYFTFKKFVNSMCKDNYDMVFYQFFSLLWSLKLWWVFSKSFIEYLVNKSFKSKMKNENKALYCPLNRIFQNLTHQYI